VGVGFMFSVNKHYGKKYLELKDAKQLIIWPITFQRELFVIFEEIISIFQV